MSRIRIFLVFLSLIAAQASQAQLHSHLSVPFDIEKELNSCSPELIKLFDAYEAETPKQRRTLLGMVLEKAGRSENPRVIAALLTLALGPFGVHRMYLGTDTKVPVFYTLTLGGGLGILPVIDLLHILLTKDLSQFYNHPGVFMWGGTP